MISLHLAVWQLAVGTGHYPGVYQFRSLIIIARYAVAYANRRVAVGVAIRNAKISNMTDEDHELNSKRKRQKRSATINHLVKTSM